jgi:glycosyltransferase involved in cell wall biosynthesis
MRIAINLLCIIPGINGGVETYARSLLRALAVEDRTNEYLVFVNREGAALRDLEAPNISTVIFDFNARRRPVRYAWEQILLPRELRRRNVDLLHSPGYVGPLRSPCPTVVTIPDVNFVALGNALPAHKRAALGYFCSSSAKRADRVITISQFSKEEIVKHLRIPEQKIVVTHLGPGTIAEPTPWNVVSQRYGIEGDYVVAFAGNNYPHKNIARLIEAFAKVRTSPPAQLVIIGELSADLRELAKSKKIRFRDLAGVPNADVGPILGHARLCVVPSLYEGFGLPVLEAQNAGVPLICSNAAALPEVAGRGCQFVNAKLVDEIAGAIEHCLGDSEYCHSLVRAGRANLKRFSWARTAEETLSVYNEVAGTRTPIPDLRGTF